MSKMELEILSESGLFQAQCEEFRKLFLNIKKESVRKLCNSWLERLKNCNENESKLRCAYMRLLIKQLKKNVLNDPFVNIPDPLCPLKPLTKQQYRSEILHSQDSSSYESLTMDDMPSSEYSSDETSTCSSFTVDDSLKVHMTRNTRKNKHFSIRQDLIDTKLKLNELKKENEKMAKQNLSLQLEIEDLKTNMAKDYIKMDEFEKLKQDQLESYKNKIKNKFKYKKDEQEELIQRLTIENNKLLKLNDQIIKEKEEQRIVSEQTLLREKMNFQNEKIRMKEDYQKDLNKELFVYNNKIDNLENAIARLEKDKRKLMRQLDIEQKDASNERRSSETLEMIRDISNRVNIWSDICDSRNLELERITENLESKYRNMLEEHQKTAQEENEKHLQNIARLQLELAKHTEVIVDLKQ